jgi:hypothetical protein
VSAVLSPPPGSPGKIRIGFFSFTEVTDPAAHRSYNEWHQLDHLPEQLPLTGIAWGQRWVLSPRCRQVRTAAAPPLDRVHYLTMYLMSEPVAETLEAFSGLGAELHRLGRFHEQRTSHLSGPFDVLSAHAAGRVLVSGAAVPYRPNTGAYAFVEDGGTLGDDEALRAPRDPAELLAIDGVAGVWSFAGARAPARWKPGRRRVTVCFVDSDPVTVAGGVEPRLRHAAAEAGTDVVFAAPFETITAWRWDWFDGDDGA